MREEYEIIVNGDSKTVPVFTLTQGHHITYDFVANLGGYMRYRMIQPEVTYVYPEQSSRTFEIWPKAGDLYPGETVKLVDGMIFYATVTDRT